MRAVRVLPLLLLLACTASRENVEPTPTEEGSSSEEAPPAKTTVEVRNLMKADVDFYVVRGADRVRLDFVPGMSTRSFVIPPHVVGKFEHLRFGTEIIGRDWWRVSDQEMPVRPGDALSLTIPG